MECKDLIVDGLSRVDEVLRTTVKGLSEEQLAFRPAENTNSIAWLAWHLTRVQDGHMAEVIEQPQLWIRDGWHERFGRPADPADSGYGASPEQVASIRPPGPEVLEQYHAAVYRRSVEILSGISCADMDRIVDTNWDPPVTLGVRLISVVDDCAQHAGQMAYVRGLIEGRRWYPW
jgi:hypothetical protein